MEICNTSLYHTGIEKSAMKEAVLQKLAIGQQYKIKSVHASPLDEGKVVKCQLEELSKNVAVFRHKNGTTESFTYQELWIQMMNGTLV